MSSIDILYNSAELTQAAYATLAQGGTKSADGNNRRQTTVYTA